MEQGFYKKDNDNVLFGEKAVYNSNYTLLIENKESYSYPIDGWYYFDTKAEAYSAFGLEMPEE